MDAVAILPEEMWKCIIDKLDTYEDKLCAYNTCKLWRFILLRNRAEWMFHGIFPSLSKYLEPSDILKCRQVCKSWNKAVDSYLQTDQPFNDNDLQKQYEPYQHITTRTLGVNFNVNEERLGITTEEALKRFQIDFSSSGVPTVKSPFILRSLRITLQGIDKTSLKFFEKFGAHLHCLRLSIICLDREDTCTLIQLVTFVWKLLRLVPNLKKLELLTCEFILYFLRGTEEPIVQKQEVESFFRRNSAPPLPQLHSIKLTGTFYRMNQVLETAYGPRRTNHVRHSFHDPVPPNLTNLTELAWNFDSLDRTDKLNVFKSLDCPTLQQLRIYVKRCAAPQLKNSNTCLQLLFEAIERFQSSLTYLEIIWKQLEPNFSAQLSMPFVQELSLKIAVCENPKSLKLSFLQGLKSLRKLKCVFSQLSYAHFVEIQKEMCHSTKETVDLHYYLQNDKNGGPYKSNVWRLLPSLDMIEIQVTEDISPYWVIKTNIYTRYELNEM